MSARQNKKQRKGRGVHQRERTVTTLTEDPNTHYLVPTPSEEPAGGSLAFNNAKMPNIQMGPHFQMGGNFQYGTYPAFNSMHPNVQQQQQQQQPFFAPPPSQQQQQQPLSQPQPQVPPQQQYQSQPVMPTLPPGKNDLEILQNLKKIIKDGQHPYFRAIPQPAALASIYMGTLPIQSQAQGPQGETPGDSAEGQSTVDTATPRPTMGVSVPTDARPIADTDRDSGPTSGGPLHGPDYIPPNQAPGDSRPTPVDSRPQPDSRGTLGSSQGPSVDSRSERVDSVVDPPSRASTSDIVPSQGQTQPSVITAVADTDDIQSSRSSSLRPADTANQNLGLVPSVSEEGMVGGGRPGMPIEDNGPRPSLKERLVPPRNAGRASEYPSHYGDHPGPRSGRFKFYKDRGGAPGGASFDGPPRPGDRVPSGFGTPPGNGTPMSGSGGQAPPRSFHQHSPPPEGRGAKPLSSPPGHRHPLRGPSLGRPMGREDRGNYRAEYDPRRPDVLDDPMARYGDRPYRDVSPPLGEIPRGGGGDRGGRPVPFPSSPGRAPPGGDISGRRGEWQYHYPSGVSQNWDVEEWDRSGDRDRFERDAPPRSGGWDYRERDFIARDGYSSGPLHDDRGYAPGPPNRDTDRGRPPGPYTPPYGRVRPRSSSPMGQTAPASMDDSRPTLKRSREEFPPAGYYHAPLGNRDGPGPMRRPPGEYPTSPPRSVSASSGPPPSSASTWPPPMSGGSNAGGPSGDRDRDYRMGRDVMDFAPPPPPSAGYDRPRSPGPLGRHSYGRGGGGGGYGRGDPRDRGGYGMAPPRP